jgi:hypothetical protein
MDEEKIFPTEPVPSPAEIVVPFEGDTDRGALAACLASRKWTSITYEYLRRCYPGPLSEAFTYLTTKGQAYFLPAFIRMCKEQPRGSDALPASILFEISRDTPRRRELLTGLTAEQKRYLLQFFQKFYQPEPTRWVELQEAAKALG